MDRRTLGEVRTGQGTLRKVRDVSVDPQGGPGRIRGLGEVCNSRGILGEVRNMSGDSR